MVRIERVVSGGQSGVDRAALDAARALGLAHGGWCPRGRRAEDGRIPQRYRLRETDSTDPRVRTAWNVRDSDGTLILADGPLEGGTALTAALVAEQGKPLRIADPAVPSELTGVSRWLESRGIRILNVAGPRESKAPGIHNEALGFLLRLFSGTPAAP